MIKKNNLIGKRVENELNLHKTHPGLRVDKPPFPQNLIIDLCNGCNHECLFCMNRLMTRKVKRMSFNFYKKVLKEAKKLGVKELGLYATGEPFMHTKLEEFVLLAKEMGFSYVYTTTNGALVDEKRLKKVIDCGLDSIKFSVNAGSRKTYKTIHGKDEWEKVCKNINFVSNYRDNQNLDIKLSISSVVTNLTFHEKEDLRKKFENIVDEIFFSLTAAYN